MQKSNAKEQCSYEKTDSIHNKITGCCKKDAANCNAQCRLASCCSRWAGWGEEMFIRTNLQNKSLISADRNNKATLLLTILCSI